MIFCVFEGYLFLVQAGHINFWSTCVIITIFLNFWIFIVFNLVMLETTAFLCIGISMFGIFNIWAFVHKIFFCFVLRVQASFSTAHDIALSFVEFFFFCTRVLDKITGGSSQNWDIFKTLHIFLHNL